MFQVISNLYLGGKCTNILVDFESLEVRELTDFQAFTYKSLPDSMNGVLSDFENVSCSFFNFKNYGNKKYCIYLKGDKTGIGGYFILEERGGKVYCNSEVFPYMAEIHSVLYAEKSGDNLIFYLDCFSIDEIYTWSDRLSFTCNVHGVSVEFSNFQGLKFRVFFPYLDSRRAFFDF